MKSELDNILNNYLLTVFMILGFTFFGMGYFMQSFIYTCIILWALSAICFFISSFYCFKRVK